jgi:gliding motility-associated-like protein
MAQEECGQKQYLNQIETQQPQLLQKRLKIEERCLLERQKSAERFLESRTLPVVFHIIYNSSSDPVSDSEIYKALDLLNEAFSNTGYYQRVDGQDPSIKFCLAQQDDKGQQSSGINRIQSPLTNLQIIDDDQLKRLISWDPNHVINIYLVNSINDGTVAGYAYLPYNHGSVDDGIVVLNSVIKNQSVGMHSTLVHEMGHYLGLYHTFEGGCENHQCEKDGDKVCDTPPDGTTAGPGFCEAIINSCDTDKNSGFTKDTVDLNWNYLDYGNRNCRKGFTLGQAERMHYFIENARFPLLSSIFCEQPCLENITSYFVPDSLSVQLGKEMNFVNQSTNGSKYKWLINGIEISNLKDLKYKFPEAGLFEITLITQGTTFACLKSYTVLIEVVCPLIAKIIPSKTTCKAGESVTFTHNYLNGKLQEWRVNNSFISSMPTFSYGFNKPGDYTVLLQTWDPLYPSCIVYDTILIKVVCDADASFQASDNFINKGTSVNFQLIDQPKDSVIWIIDGSRFSSQSVASYPFNEAGSFQICAINTSGFCKDTSCQIIFVLSDTIKGSCDEYGLSVYGTNGSEEAFDIVNYNGKLIIAGAESNIPCIFACDANGKIEWKARIDIFGGRTAFIRNVLLDGDYLVMVGFSFPYTDNFIVKFDLNTFSIAWSKIWKNNKIDDDVLVDVLNGSDHYYVFGQSYNNSPGLGCDALYIKIQKSDGNIVLHNNFDLGSCEEFKKSLLINDAIYCVGRFNNAGGGTDKFRGSLTKLDLNGNYLWSRLYVKEPNNATARLYTTDLVSYDSNIYIGGFGNLTGTNLDNVVLNLIKTDLNGKAQWQKQYEIEKINNESLLAIEKGEDGIYLLCNGSLSGGSDIVVVKTDFEGNVLWSKIVDGGGNESAYQIYSAAGRIHVVGKTTSKGYGNTDVLYFSLGPDGTLTENKCFSAKDIKVQASQVPNAHDGNISLKPFSINLSLDSKNTQVNVSLLQKSPDCENICQDTCSNGVALYSAPDALFQNALAYCNNKRIGLKFSLCNLDSIALPAGNPITIYDKNPFISKANVVYQFLIDKPVLPYSCEEFDVLTDLLPNTTYYLVANDAGTGNTPFNLNTQFPTTGVEECNYENNLFKIDVLIPESPILDLGPDIFKCANEVVVLTSNNMFNSYIWSDGGKSISTSVGDPGKYWLLVTDACGFEQSDTIEIKLLQQTSIDLPDTFFVCNGKLEVSFPGSFSAVNWYPPGAVLCDTCQATILSTPESQTLYVVVNKENHCISTDSVFVKNLLNSEAFIDKQLCESDTLYFLDKAITLPGDYEFKLTNAVGCDSTINLKILLKPAPTATIETVNSCPDEKTGGIKWNTLPENQVWFNGQIQSGSEIGQLPSGIYNLNIVNPDGCVHDTQLVILEYILPPLEFNVEAPDCDDEQSGSIYFQDEVEIFDGNFNFLGKQAVHDLSSGDYYFQIRNNLFLCFVDTTIVVPPAGDTLNIIYPDTVYIQKNIPFLIEPGYNTKNVIYEWLPGEGLDCNDCAFPTLKIANNAAYTVEVTDEAGCTAVKSITFLVALNVEFSNIILLNSESNSKWTLHNLIGKQKIKIDIFDRWGNLIHHYQGAPNDDGTYSWDGTLNGKKVEQGVYVAILEYIDEKGIPVKKFFDLTVVSQ